MNYTVISTFFFGLLIASLCAVSELHADEAEDTQVQSSLLSLFTDADADGAAEKHGRPADVSALEWHQAVAHRVQPHRTDGTPATIY